MTTEIIPTLRVARVVNGIFSSITYILSLAELNDVWLVDCGDTDRVLSVLPKGTIIKGVFLTHTHFDHIYGLNRLIEKFPFCVIYTTAYGKEALYSDRLNFSRYHETSFVFKGNTVQTIDKPCYLPLSGNLKVEVIPTPGHSPDSLSYIIDDKIFTGDTYIPSIKTVTTLRGGSKVKAQQSQETILYLYKERGLHICPGHQT